MNLIKDQSLKQLTLSALRHWAASDIKNCTCKFLRVTYKQDGDTSVNANCWIFVNFSTKYRQINNRQKPTTLH